MGQRHSPKPRRILERKRGGGSTLWGGALRHFGTTHGARGARHETLPWLWGRSSRACAHVRRVHFDQEFCTLEPLAPQSLASSHCICHCCLGGPWCCAKTGSVSRDFSFPGTGYIDSFACETDEMKSQSEGFLSLSRGLCRSFCLGGQLLHGASGGQHSVLGQSWV